jgi:hypothetical protein
MAHKATWVSSSSLKIRAAQKQTSDLFIAAVDAIGNLESPLGDADASLGRLLRDRHQACSGPAVPGNDDLAFLPLFDRFHQA